MNLVGSRTLKDVWCRHILDSAQILPYIDRQNTKVLDLGTGAGFPGLVLSIMGVTGLILMESNKKKCIFLEEIIRHTSCDARVYNGRIENYPELKSAQCIVARALAPLEKLLYLGSPLLAEGGRCLFIKGENFEQELTASKKRWNMDVEVYFSNVNPMLGGGNLPKELLPGVLLEIRNLSLRE